MNSIIPRIVSLQDPLDPESSSPAAERVVEGHSKHLIANYYVDPTQQFFAGRWSGTKGAWRVRYTETEFCHLLAGRVRLTSTDGVTQEFGVGDSFVVPAGFEGTWTVLEDCTKVYALFEVAAPL